MRDALLVRTDAGYAMGTGHVMRSLALAQGWQEAGGEVVFATAENTPSLKRRLADEQMEEVSLAVPPGGQLDAEQTVSLARRRRAAWVMIDGYQFDGRFQQYVKDAGLWLLTYDDFGHCERYHADLVLNPNLSAFDTPYPPCDREVEFLLGPRFALLRREFRQTTPRVRPAPPTARRVLVTFGGSDPQEQTPRVVRLLAELGLDLEVAAILGGDSRNRRELESLAEQGRMRLRVEQGVKDMPGWLSWADLAISAGGSTSLELAYLGIPSLLVVVADNQVEGTRWFCDCGLAESAGRAEWITDRQLGGHIAALLADQSRRQQMSQAGRRCVDALGVERVLAHMGTRQAVGRAA